MTNQEWLQQNNAKIEALQEKLANKVVAKGTIDITENGKHNVAGYSDANINVQPNLTDKTVTENGTYNAIDEGFDGYLSVTVNVGGGLEINLPSVFARATQIYYVSVDGDRLLISSNAQYCGLWLYTVSDNSIVQIYDESYTWQYFQQVTDTKWLIGGGSGILLYNSEDDSCVRIYTKAGSWQYFQQVSDTKWLISTSGATYPLMLYESESDELIIIAEKRGYLKCQQVSDTKWLIGANAGSFTILLYNSEDDSCVQIYDITGAWRSFEQVTDTKWLIGGGSGILLYNSEDDSCVQIYDIGSYWYYFYKTTDGKCLIGGDDSSNRGVLLYNSKDDSFTQIYTSGYNWKYFQQVTDTKCLISGSGSSAGILMYNAEDDSVKQVYSSGRYWGYLYKVSDLKCLIINNSSSNLILLYNAEDDSVKQVYSGAYNYNICTPDTNNNYYLSSSDKTKIPQTLYYTESDDSIKLVGYYLGEV